LGLFQNNPKSKEPKQVIFPGLTSKFACTCGFALAVAVAGALSPADARSVLDEVLAAREEPVYEIGDSADGNFLAAYVAEKRQDMRAASAYYQQLMLDHPKDADILSHAFLATLEDSDFETAFDIADKLYKRDKHNTLAQLALTVRHFKKGRFKQARALLQPGVRGGNRDVASTLMMAWAHVGSKNRSQAEKTLALLGDNPSISAWKDYHLGLVRGVFADANGAVQALEKAYRGDSSSLKIVDAYARALSRQGNNARAAEVYRRFADRLPDQPLVQEGLKQLESGKPLDFAVHSAQEGVNEVLFVLSAAAADGRRAPGNELPSIIYLQLALYLEPTDPMSVMTLVEIFLRMRQYDLVLKTLARVPEESPIRSEADVEIGYALSHSGRRDEAKQFFEECVAKYPDDINLLLALGDTLRGEQNWVGAADIYTRAIQRIGTPKSRHWTMYFARGTVYERAGQWDKAEPDLQKAMELVPPTHRYGTAQVLNYLGYSWVDRNENIDAAFKMLQEAIRLSPQDGAIIDSLGWAYFRLGRYDDAVRELERAIELKPADPVLNDHLGDAYWKTGRKNEARFQWRHALSSRPEADTIPIIEKKLEVGLDAVLAEQKDAKPAAETKPGAAAQ
jgi:tetratricopeptide (TPR) repeat protein